MNSKHPNLNTAWPTRIEYCAPLSLLCNRGIYLKREDAADDIGSGNKVRKLEKLLPCLQATGVRHIILDGTTQSNSCMSVAFYAPQYGITPHLILYGDTEPKGNYAKILASAAEVHLLPEWDPSLIAEERKTITATIAADLYYDAPTGLSSSETVSAGRDIVSEIVEQEEALGIVFNDVYIAAGTGGTVAGAAFQDALLGHTNRITGIVVANNSSFFRDTTARLFGHMADGDGTYIPDLPQFYEGARGGGYGVATSEQLLLQKELRDKGYFFDSVYMLKVCAAAIQLSREKHSSREPALILHTGGANQQELSP